MRLAFTKLQVRLQDGMQDQAEIFLAWLKTWSAWGTLIRELVVVLADPPSVTDNSPTYPLPWEEIASFMNSENSTQIYYISLRDERRQGGDKWKLESLLDTKYTSNPNHQTRETVVDLYEDILLYYLDNN
jgi:hypothetical protein